MGYSLHEHSKPAENPEHPLSLQGHKEVNYSLMLTSDLDSEPESGCRKPKKYQPSASGPSALRQWVNNHAGASKSFQTKTPIHSYLIRGYKQPSKISNAVSDNTLSVETDQDTQPKTPQVEITNTPVQVEIGNLLVNVKTDPLTKGMSVTRSFELKKYKRPRKFKCKICGDSSSSVKKLNVHH